MNLINISSLSKKFYSDPREQRKNSLASLISCYFPKTTGCRLKKGEFWAIEDITISFASGEIVGISGPNGAGKTTLLKLICGILKPDFGCIKTSAQPISLFSFHTQAFNSSSVYETIIYMGALCGLAQPQLSRNLDWIIDFAEFSSNMDRNFRCLSPGQKIRLFLAVIMASNPAIIALDDILSFADTHFKEKFFAEIQSRADSTILIFATHENDLLMQFATRTVTLNKGQLVNNSVTSQIIKPVIYRHSSICCNKDSI